MNISFFKTPSHRVFHYEPRYWDERKERREQVRQDALREKALREGNLTRIIGLVSVAIFFAFLIYFAKYFTVFLESMR